MRSETIRFHEVKMQGEKRIKCSVCGKPMIKRKIFSQTVNPFNKNKDGSIKSENQIWNELQAEIRDWQSVSEVCGKCRENS